MLSETPYGVPTNRPAIGDLFDFGQLQLKPASPPVLQGAGAQPARAVPVSNFAR